MTDDFSEIFSIRGKTALITGGSRGIGYMIAEGFLRAGATVYIASKDASKLALAETSLAPLGNVKAIQCDVSNADDCGSLIEAVQKDEGKLHILVNNAGKSCRRPINVFPDDKWDEVLSTNLVAPFRLTRLALPLLRTAYTEDDPARVIVLSLESWHPPFDPTFGGLPRARDPGECHCPRPISNRYDEKPTQREWRCDTRG
jgi:NAD(P)-dependent dehydrogenase (short-subunit alcohol dehydrogenase family)